MIDRVPRTGEEEAQLLETRPGGWEYLYWAAELLRLREELEPKWQEYEQKVRRPGAREMTDAEAMNAITAGGAFERAGEIIATATKTFNSPDVQEAAFGKPGEEGDPEKIKALSASLMAGYSGLLDWAAGYQADGVPERFRVIYDAVSELADEPLQQYREYVDRVVSELDKVPAALRKGGPIELELRLTLSIDDSAQARLQQEFDNYIKRIEREGDEAVAALSPDIPVPAGLGFFETRRAKKLIAEHQRELAEWAAERSECAERLELAKSYAGEASAQLILKRGEALFASITGASLIEERRGAGQWQGRSSGFSIPVASIGGRSIRYRTGSSRGHYVQGVPIPTAIDVGTFFITNQRAVFQGVKQTRECRFDKLVGFQHLPDGSTVFSVSNRQKPTQVAYGSDLSGWVDFRLDLALAHYQDTVPALIAQLESDLSAIDASVPPRPALPTPK